MSRLGVKGKPFLTLASHLCHATCHVGYGMSLLKKEKKKRKKYQKKKGWSAFPIAARGSSFLYTPRYLDNHDARRVTWAASEISACGKCFAPSTQGRKAVRTSPN